MSRRFPWILTLCVAPVLAVLIGLGVWQSQRLTWKQGLIAAAQAAAERPVAPLDQVLAEGGSPEFRRVLLDCPDLASAPVVELQTIQDGVRGLRLIAACTPMGGDAWLVDLGFMDEAASAPAPGAAGPASETLPPVQAVIRATPAPGPMALEPEGRRFYARDAAAMARALGVTGPIAPWTLFVETPIRPGLAPSVPPAAFSNNHLGYAATWFGLALVLMGFYIAMLIKRLRP